MKPFWSREKLTRASSSPLLEGPGYETRTPSRRLLLAAALGLLCVSAAACGLFGAGDDGVRSQFGERPSAESGLGLIAYVGLDGQVRTVSPDGSGEQIVSPRTGVYSWPAWSPDGRNLVFSGLADGSDGQPRSTLFDRDLSTGELARIHVGTAR